MQKILTRLPPKSIEILKYDWHLFARDKQIAPPGSWRTWLPLAGRGWGKTRVGSEWIRENVSGKTPLSPGRFKRIALIGETVSDVRDVMVKGDSGIMSITPKDYRPTYVANRRALVWPNGTEALMFSAIQPEQLRGPQFDAAWCDELAKWRYAQYAWDMLQMGLRLGECPQALVTTTPKPIDVLKDIIADPSTVVVRGATFENAGNLSGGFIDYVKRKYSGTRLGRQEIEGMMLDAVEGALWTDKNISDNRIRFEFEEGKSESDARNKFVQKNIDRVCVAVDPPVTSGEKADECGIIVGGVSGDARNQSSRGYVIEDCSEQGLTPRGWAEKAVAAYHRHNADIMVAEVNNGGELVETVVRQVDPNVNYKAVHASKGKFARAEPVSALYEQNRVCHIGTFDELEGQMTTFTLEGLPDPNKSPDRVDALVWCITKLMLDGVAAEPRARKL